MRWLLVFLSHHAVHVPVAARPVDVEHYQAKAAGLKPAGPEFLPEHENQVRQIQNNPAYAGMVKAAADSLGRIVAKLRELGLDDNTAIIFFSDNGGLSTAEGSPTSNVPLRAGKGWLYEGGIRMPLIIQWPGVTKPGSVCRTPVTSTDFYPTLLAMAGLSARPDQHQDGVSLVPLLQQSGGVPRDALYWHYPHYSNQGGTPGGVIRVGDWKLIEFFEDMHVELYNLAADLGEKNDLAAAEPGQVRELREQLHAWRQATGAPMPTPTPNPRWPSH